MTALRIGQRVRLNDLGQIEHERDYIKQGMKPHPPWYNWRVCYTYWNPDNPPNVYCMGMYDSLQYPVDRWILVPWDKPTEVGQRVKIPYLDHHQCWIVTSFIDDDVELIHASPALPDLRIRLSIDLVDSEVRW